MAENIKLVSMTPAVFHLSEAVNAVSRSYGKQPIVPRGPRLKPLIDGVRNSIRGALDAPNYEPIMMTGSGSTAIASVLGSCFAPGERLLVVSNGAYGVRMATFSERIGLPHEVVEMAYGERPDLERIEQLCADGLVDAIAMVYGCTSTCALNPIAEVGAIAKRYDKRFFLDGVSALFVEPMDLEALGISAVMGSCNKGLHSHPNLTFALVHSELLKKMQHYPPRAPSLELYQIWEKQRVGSHPFTIDPMSLLQVQAALGHLASQGGVAGRHAIYQKRCTLLRAGYERLGLKLANWPGMPPQSIGTALMIPEGGSYDKLASVLAEDPVEGHAFEIYSAQGDLSSTVFRVFHMGDYDLPVYEIFLRALERAMNH